ncbi:MAG: peptidoglycan editing factor PgeF [Firmicutes bacterium]|nr:peptidoglycan editing factor PgeF [Bacillota bacterium]
MSEYKSEAAEVLDFQLSNGVGYWEPRGIPTPARLVCAFSSRKGGVSEGPFTSLNLGLHVGDQPDHVLANRQRFSKALGIDARHWVAAEQVHGCKLAVVGVEDRGRGALAQGSAIPGVDGLVTSEAGVWLACYYADCVPLAFWDIKQRGVGIAHAGWRGTLANIGSEVLEAMIRYLGSEPGDVHVLIGPAIGPCCYHVGEDVARAFGERFGQEPLSQREGRIYLDLRAANQQLLKESGVSPAQIHQSRLCTACQSGVFFSHRRDESPTGRMAAIIGLRER